MNLQELINWSKGWWESVDVNIDRYRSQMYTDKQQIINKLITYIFTVALREREERFWLNCVSKQKAEDKAG